MSKERACKKCKSIFEGAKCPKCGSSISGLSNLRTSVFFSMKTMSKFYQREVMNAVDTLVGMIEPVMIVALGLGVGTLLASVLIPIYNVTNSIQ